MPRRPPRRSAPSRPRSARDNVAAVLIEPIQGEGGFIVPAPGFLPALSEWATAPAAVFIADEIQTGFCRTGDWFACEHESVVPDLITTAKGIAGGMPLAAVTGRTELLNAVHPGGLGGTYGGNPVAVAGALAAIGVMRDEGLAARCPAARRADDGPPREARRRGGHHRRGPRPRGDDRRRARAARKPRARRRAGKSVVAACAAEGVIALSCGTYGNVLRLLPPLVISEALLDEGLGVLEGALRAAS